MEGVKEFTNNTCIDLRVIITIRCGSEPGCSDKKEEFCLKRYERKCITFGNKCYPFLDGIRVCSDDHILCSETCLFVTKCGGAVDRLLNTHHHITFLAAGECIVVSNFKC
jgi:hypothetical protein